MVTGLTSNGQKIANFLSNKLRRRGEGGKVRKAWKSPDFSTFSRKGACLTDLPGEAGGGKKEDGTRTLWCHVVTRPASSVERRRLLSARARARAPRRRGGGGMRARMRGGVWKGRASCASCPGSLWRTSTGTSSLFVLRATSANHDLYIAGELKSPCVTLCARPSRLLLHACGK